ncbi:restriction endonuclease subunit S [Bifidobacterium aquikefiri]|uniref:restriction endonuclease subunit S n=1 Tax=Bifidobacterium aquikefiri TaxID=1653207 RepID=UPI0039E9B63F
MSRIEELLKEFCSNGVRHYEMCDIAEYSQTRIDAAELDEASFVGVDNLLPNKGGRTDANYSPNTSRLTAFSAGDLLIGNIRPYLKKIWLANRNGGCSGDVLAIHLREQYQDQLEPRFLYYLLSSDNFFAYDMQHAKGAKMPRGDKDAIMKFRVPVPPLPVQKEIVRILDSFISLEAELEAELEARKRQYEHYRNGLFKAAENDVQWSTLGKISTKASSGGTPTSGRSEYYGGGIPWLRTQEVNFNSVTSTSLKITDEGLANSSATWIPKHSVIVAMYGATAAKVAINEIPLTTNQACCNLQIDPDQAEYRYVFYWIVSQYEKLKSLGEGSQSNLNAGKVKKFPIPIPDMEKQQRIVSILDRFDALVSDLSSGLPAEIAARRKQYEYYRDRLLTFKELTV